MTDIPSAADLMPALQFTPEDLAANREQRTGESQQHRLRQLRLRSLLFGIGGFYGFALVATIFLFLGTQQSTAILLLIGIAITILNAVYVGMIARQVMRLNADLRQGSVDVIQGEMERVLSRDRRMSNYILRIADAEFVVKKETFKLFRHEVTYAIYRAPRSGVLLAAEPLTD